MYIMEYLIDPIEAKLTESLEKLFGPHDNMVKAAIKMTTVQYSPEEEYAMIEHMRKLNAKEALLAQQFSCTLDASGNVVQLPTNNVTITDITDAEQTASTLPEKQ